VFGLALAKFAHCRPLVLANLGHCTFRCRGNPDSAPLRITLGACRNSGLLAKVFPKHAQRQLRRKIANPLVPLNLVLPAFRFDSTLRARDVLSGLCYA
jgi:hypothetical protein